MIINIGKDNLRSNAIQHPLIYLSNAHVYPFSLAHFFIKYLIVKVRSMKQVIIDNYNSVMNAKYNPLRHIPNQNVRHAVMLGLMFMWCAIFAVWTGAIVIFGASVFFHFLLLFGILVTLGTFEIAKGRKVKKEKPPTKLNKSIK